MLDPKTDISNNHVHISNPPAPKNPTLGTTNFGSRVRKTAQNYENYRNSNGGNVQFRAEEKTEDDSGVSSPPLWNSYRYLSPNSRSQAIARGQWEIMEMVKNMPESCYELSLKDLVDQPIRVVETQEEKCLAGEKIVGRKGVSQSGVGVKRLESRGRSVDSSGGLLLKMVSPFSLGSKKTKKKNQRNVAAGGGSSSRVSPRPDVVLDSKSSKGVEKEWWKKRFSVSSESEYCGGGSSATSSGGSSRSSSGRKRSGCSPGCWSFLSKKNKNTSK